MSIVKQAEFNYRSYHQLIETIFRRSSRFREFEIVVGVPRSGLVPASLLATHLNVPFLSLPELTSSIDRFTGFRKLKTNKPLCEAKILLVDDSVNSGRQILKVKSILDPLNLNIKTMAVYATENGKSFVDYWIEELEYPRLFQWNILNHEVSSRSCYDLDGVLCVDPTLSDTTTESKYVKFIKDSPSIHIPSHPIKAIVTSRLERYRAETVDWLQKNEVKYNELIMLDGISTDQRRTFMLHAAFKAEVYKESDAVLFFESSTSQAIAISRISSKPCFAVENMSMYHGSHASEGIHLKSLTRDIPNNKAEAHTSRLKNYVYRAFNRLSGHIGI